MDDLHCTPVATSTATHVVVVGRQITTPGFSRHCGHEKYARTYKWRIGMTLREWSDSQINYGRKLMNSGLEGAHQAEAEYLHGEAVGPFIKTEALNSFVPAVVGACIGVLSAQ